MNVFTGRKCWKTLGILMLVMILLLSFGCTSEDTAPTQPDITTQVEPSTSRQPESTASQTTEPSSEEPIPTSTGLTEQPSTEITTEATEPSVETSTEAVTDTTPSTQPTQPATQPTSEPTLPATEPITQPVTEPTTLPATEPTSPATEPTTQPTIPETTPPATQETTPPATEPVTQPTVSTEPPEQQGFFQIHFIDVGQADAALIQCDDQTMLIDGGNVDDSSLMYTYLKNQGVDHLDYVIGTHAHEDHIGGIAGALNYASVDQTFCPVTTYTTKAFRNFVKAVERHGSSITVPSVGDSFYLGSASCQVLGVNTTDETNNSSIVLRIVYGDTSFLFTGDVEWLAENIIMNQGSPLNATVLKVAHHGSVTSTGYLWLREVDPDYAVISVGKGNSYGHPTEEVLSRLRDAEVTTFRTDLQGDIICTSDGKTVSFRVSKNADADVFGGIGGNSTQNPGRPEETQPTTGAAEGSSGTDYVLNTNTKKFHYPTCHSAQKISAKNRQDYHGTREELIEDGYDPCKNCDP